MNVICAICTELLPNSDNEIHSTPCGHLFHLACLSKWLATSKTCPQCRNKCRVSSTFRIYFNVMNSCNDTVDVAALEQEIEKKDLQLRQEKTKISEFEIEVQNLRKERATAVSRADKLETKASRAELLLESFKNKCKLYSYELNRIKAIELKYNEISSKAALLEKIDMLIKADAEERVEEIVGSENDFYHLKIMVKSMKRELQLALGKRKEFQMRLRRNHNDLQEARDARNDAEEKLKLLESENEHLRKKQRILDSQPLVLKENSPGISVNSPSIPEQVQKIQDSDSPYLRIKSSSIGLAPILRLTGDKRSNLSKRPRFNGSSTDVFRDMPLSENIKITSGAKTILLKKRLRPENMPSNRPADL